MPILKDKAAEYAPPLKIPAITTPSGREGKGALAEQRYEVASGQWIPPRTMGEVHGKDKG